jgi:hypothetical protein
VDHLRPWKDHKSVAAITAAANHQLEVFLKLAPLQAMLFDRARNRTRAKKLDRALNQVELLLASAPGALAWFLFDPLSGLETFPAFGTVFDGRPPLDFGCSCS